jgi:hypothetical protein
MNLKQLLSLSCFVVLLASCTKFYGPALYHQDIAYMPKPASFDSVKSATYVSAGIGGYTQGNINDLLISGQLNLSQGYAFKNFNLAYGAFGSFGNYDNGTISKGDPNYFTDKFFGAVGGRLSGNFFVNSGRADWRFIGFEAAYSHEFGSYADFRQSVQSLSGYSVDPRTNLFTIGLTTEVLFHNIHNTDFQNGIRGFLGTTFGRNDMGDTYFINSARSAGFLDNVFPKASYFIKFKQYFGSIEVGEDIMLRFGLKF